MRATVEMLKDVPNIDAKIQKFVKIEGDFKKQTDKDWAKKKAQDLRDAIPLKKGKKYAMSQGRAAELVASKDAKQLKTEKPDRSHPKEEKK